MAGIARRVKAGEPRDRSGSGSTSRGRRMADRVPSESCRWICDVPKDRVLAGVASQDLVDERSLVDRHLSAVQVMSDRSTQLPSGRQLRGTDRFILAEVPKGLLLGVHLTTL